MANEAVEVRRDVPISKKQQRKQEVGGLKVKGCKIKRFRGRGRLWRVKGFFFFFVPKRLCAGASLSLCETLSDQCTGVDDTSL